MTTCDCEVCQRIRGEQNRAQVVGVGGVLVSVDGDTLDKIELGNGPFFRTDQGAQGVVRLNGENKFLISALGRMSSTKAFTFKLGGTTVNGVSYELAGDEENLQVVDL